MDPRGTLLVTTSAASFGLMSVLAKDTEVAQAGVTTVLSGRFLLAALLFAALAAARGTRLRQLPRGAVLGALALGAGVYAVESTIFFSALSHLDASIASLVLCTYPAVVLVLAVALRREQASARQVAALGLALGGSALVLATGVRGQLDAVGLVLCAVSTLLYATYVIVAEPIARRLDPLAFGGLLSAGAAGALLVGGAAAGRLHPEAYTDPAVLTDVALMASVSTVLAVAAFVAGMRRIGATGASVVASVEPLFTVALAAVLLGETLAPLQLLGGAVLLAGILLVQAPPRDTLTVDGPPARPAAPAPARALALEPA